MKCGLYLAWWQAGGILLLVLGWSLMLARLCACGG